MSTFDVGENSINIAKWYRDVPLTIEELNRHEGRITKECRKYLIGKICEREGNKRDPGELVIDVYTRLGEKFGYTGASLKKLVTVARSIDYLYKTAPDIATDILAGRTRLSLLNLLLLVKMDMSDIRLVMDRLATEKTSPTIIFREQKERPKMKDRRGRPKGYSPVLTSRTSVKDIPPYDPDSQVMALSFTVPSWVSAIDRVFMNADFRKISQLARDKLRKELTELKDIADSVITALSDE